MTERVEKLLKLIKTRAHYPLRCTDEWEIDMVSQPLDAYQQATLFLKSMLQREQPRFLEGDPFGFVRYNAKRPTVLTENGSTLFGKRISNIIPDYPSLIAHGFDPIMKSIKAQLPHATGENLSFLLATKEQIEAMYDLCNRYRLAAEQQHIHILASALARIPFCGATSFYEACLMQKIVLYCLHCANHSLIPLGRFDQYMLPYFTADMEKGISQDELFETLELYFISTNYDSDLYLGEQTGDNGLSLVLGGKNTDGSNSFNLLSRLCLQAAEELCLIDPKINVRVYKDTPDSVYEMGTRLTKKGLGFPQYLNDDVIIPGLIRLGYETADAYNYAVAACWEPIIPGCAMDIPNRTHFNFPAIIHKAILEHIETSPTFDCLMDAAKEAIRQDVQRIIDTCSGREHYYFPSGMHKSPLLSVMIRGCLENSSDLTGFQVKYRNSGSHGVGISTAADSLAAIKLRVFEERSVSPQLLLKALQADYEGYEQVRKLMSSCPKMGNDDDFVDSISVELMRTFADSLSGRSNGVGGVWRAGTGSAQFYIRAGIQCGATADGRRSGEPFACSFSPAPHAKINGPLSLIRSFTKYDLSKIINSGPLTMELHHNVFRNSEGERKVAQLAKLYIQMGGHQLQLNAINKEQLLLAQKEPEKHRNLVVRVWGWSGYFCELDPEFQNHIINRTDHTVS